MISFVGKTIEAPEIVSEKRVGGKVLWKYGKYYVKIDGVNYEIKDVNNLTKIKWIYALPTNRYFTPWYRKPYTQIEDNNALEMTLRFWGKYKQGMTIYGRIENGIFTETKSFNVITRKPVGSTVKLGGLINAIKK